MQVFVSRRDRNRTLLWLVALLVGLGIAYVLLRSSLPALTDQEAVAAWLDQFGVLAPLVFVGLQALQVIVAPIPGQVVVLVGGYLFGAVAGTAYSLLGATIGSAVVFWVARRYGRTYVEGVVTPAMLDRFDRLAEDRVLPALFVAFLVPGLPDDVLCFLGGLTQTRLWKLVAVSFVGRLPSYAVVSLIGFELANRNLVFALGLLVVLGVLAVVGYVSRDRILGRFED